MALLALLATGLVVADAGVIQLLGALTPLAALAAVAARRVRAARRERLFTWQQVQLDLERELRRTMRRSRWRHLLRIGAPTAGGTRRPVGERTRT